MKIHVERFQRYMLAFDITLLGNAGFIDGRFSSAIDSDPEGQCSKSYLLRGVHT